MSGAKWRPDGARPPKFFPYVLCCPIGLRQIQIAMVLMFIANRMLIHTQLHYTRHADFADKSLDKAVDRYLADKTAHEFAIKTDRRNC